MPLLAGIVHGRPRDALETRRRPTQASLKSIIEESSDGELSGHSPFRLKPGTRQITAGCEGVSNTCQDGHRSMARLRFIYWMRRLRRAPHKKRAVGRDVMIGPSLGTLVDIFRSVLTRSRVYEIYRDCDCREVAQGGRFDKVGDIHPTRSVDDVPHKRQLSVPSLSETCVATGASVERSRMDCRVKRHTTQASSAGQEDIWMSSDILTGCSSVPWRFWRQGHELQSCLGWYTNRCKSSV